MFLLLVSKRTRRECIVRAGVGLITRRVGTPSHTQSTFYGEGSFIEHTSTGCAGYCKRRIGWCAREGGGDVITDHEPLGRVWEPGERHGSGKLRIGGPRGSTIR